MLRPRHAPTCTTLNQLSFQFADGDCLFDALDLRLDQRPTAIVGRGRQRQIRSPD